MNLHLTKKDFRLNAGGQHRNKHMNCCRITHIESGLISVGTSNKSRTANQREAFMSLSKKVIEWYLNKEEKDKLDLTPVIRNYNEHRNEVHDKESGLKEPWKSVMNDATNMIEARRKVMLCNDKIKVFIDEQV